MRRKRLWLAVGIGVLVTAGAAVGIIRTPRFQKWWNPPVLELPADGEIAETRASLREFQGAYSAVPEFVVPADQVPIILSWLRPAEYLREPWPLDRMDEVGEVAIRTKTGRELRLRFYWTGKNGAMFTPNGVDQFYGRGTNDYGGYVDGGMNLRIAIEKAFKALSK